MEARKSATEFNKAQEPKSELPEQYFEGLISNIIKGLCNIFEEWKILLKSLGIYMNLEMDMSKGIFANIFSATVAAFQIHIWSGSKKLL